MPPKKPVIYVIHAKQIDRLDVLIDETFVGAYVNYESALTRIREIVDKKVARGDIMTPPLHQSETHHHWWAKYKTNPHGHNKDEFFEIGFFGIDIEKD